MKKIAAIVFTLAMFALALLLGAGAGLATC